MTTPTHPPAPLDGVRVLDLSRLLPGPFCTLVLSDLGAQVDKLEDPHAGDYLRIFPPHVKGVDMSGKFAALNRDKRSLCLDLKKPEGCAAFLKLVRGYDVVVESFRPGVLDRLGLPAEAMWEANPKLVICAISGYGHDGPYRDRAGHDLNYIAIAGLLGLAGPSDASPPVPPVQIADLGGGALTAAVGIVAAMYAAQRTGQGRRVDVSMCEGSLGFALPVLGDIAASGKGPHRGGDMLTGGSAAYGVYKTADDQFLSVAPLEPKFWDAFCKTIGRRGDPSELVAGPEVHKQLRAEIAGILGQKTRAEWEQIFAGVDACVEPVLSPLEASRHPVHTRRDAFVEIEGTRYPRTALARLGQRSSHSAPPRQGQHTDAVLAERGFSAEEIAALRSAGAAR